MGKLKFLSNTLLCMKSYIKNMQKKGLGNSHEIVRSILSYLLCFPSHCGNIIYSCDDIFNTVLPHSKYNELIVCQVNEYINL